MSGELRSRASGFTLVEVVIVLALVSVVMGSVIAVLRSSMRACQVGSTAGHLEALLNRALDRIAERLQASSSSAVTPALSSPFSSPQIDFQRTIGFAGGVVAWSPTERIGFQFRPGELDDGIDNDGDGIVDDGQVIWTQDLGLPTQTSTVLADGVTKFLQGETLNNKDDNGNGLIDERGLCFTVDASSVVVRLSLAARSADGVLVTKSMEKRVFFRNR
jgi:prepilin-type N-terminal cleavage/methylation domain-containing protein